MLENVRLSFQGIWSHKMRSFLTMLGIIIGIASIISIVSTIKGTNEQIKQNLIGAGNNNVTVSLKQGDGDYWMDNGLPSGVSKLSDDQKKRIREQDQVENASFYTERTYVSGIAKGNTTLDSAKALGVDENYLSTCGYQIYQGRGFVESDFSKTHKVVLLDDTAVLTLFPDESPVGKTIEIMGEPFTVIGVIKKADSFQPVINSRDDYYTYNQESYPLVLMPDVCWPIVFQYDEPENAVVMAKTTEDMSTVGKTTADIMNESVTNTTDSLSYQAEDLLEKAKRRYRCYEYYAGICNGTYKRDRPEKGDRSKKTQNSVPVPDRGGGAHQHRRTARRAGRHYHGTGDFEGIADACGDQYSGDHFLRGLLHGDRYRIWTAAVGKSSEPESDRCAAKRIEQKRVEKSVRVQRRCWIRADFLCGVCG